jgi:hypothetical protein
LDPIAGTNQFGLVQIQINVLFEDFVVGVLVEHDQPALTLAAG